MLHPSAQLHAIPMVDSDRRRPTVSKQCLEGKIRGPDVSSNAIMNRGKPNQFCKASPEKSRLGKPAAPLIRDWIYLLGDSGRGRGRLSLMSEFAIRMQTPIEIWIQTRYSGSSKQRRGANMLSVFVEQATFTPLLFSTTDGIAVMFRYHSRLAELVATKKGESFATTISRIRARAYFALLRSALLCFKRLAIF